MGVDACFYVKTRDGNEPDMCDSLPTGCRLVPADKLAPAGATHEVDQLWRYYGPGYERGPWPIIAGVLMALHASLNVETVWYFGDSVDGDNPFTPQRVHEFNAHYMAVGDRPYRNAFKNFAIPQVVI